MNKKDEKRTNQGLWRKMRSVLNCAKQLLGINDCLLHIMLAKAYKKIISKFDYFTRNRN